jgi:PTS system galactitol-specific IIA component
MATEILSNIEVLNLDHSSSREEVLSLMAQVVIEKGFAVPGFLDAVLEREKIYPTGLHTRGVEVAIPHADPEWTIKPSLTVGVLQNPVAFEPMGGEGDLVQAKLIFMLTIADPSEHLSFLKAFATLVEDEDTLVEFEKNADIEYLLSRLQGALQEE